MATYTKNLNLAMPGYEDAADIAVLNQNAQKLDEQVPHWNMAPYPATAALTPAGALELSGSLPTEKDGLTVQFISPAAATDGLQMKFAGSDALYPILTTGEGKEPIQAGAWDIGVPVTLTVSGGSCFFKGGGQGFPAGWNEKGQGIAWDDITKNSPIVQREYGKIEDGLDLPPQPTNLPPNIVYDCAFSLDGMYLAVAHNATPYFSIYKQSRNTFIKLSNPTELPTSPGNGCAFSPDGMYVAVAYNASPYISIYKRSGDIFVKLQNPAILPTGQGEGCTFSSDGKYLAVAHKLSPYITIYKRSGDTFTKLPNLAELPPGEAHDCAFSPNDNYLVVAHWGSAHVTIYKRSGDSFTKLPNLAELPPADGRHCAFSPDEVYLAVVTQGSPYITIYKRSGDTFVKLSNPSVVPTYYGRDCQFSRDGKYLAVSASSSPWLYLYKRDGDTFTKLPDPEGLPNIELPAYSFGGISFSAGDEYLAWGYSVAPYLTIYLNEQKTYIHTLNDINKEYFAYAPKGKIGVAKESKPAGELVKATLFPALYNLTNEGGN